MPPPDLFQPRITSSQTPSRDSIGVYSDTPRRTTMSPQQGPQRSHERQQLLYSSNFVNSMAPADIENPPSRKRDIVYCHECENEWYRDLHGVTCPECQGAFTEIIETGSDPRRYEQHMPEHTLNYNEFNTPNPSDNDIDNARQQQTGPEMYGLRGIHKTTSGRQQRQQGQQGQGGTGGGSMGIAEAGDPGLSFLMEHLAPNNRELQYHRSRSARSSKDATRADHISGIREIPSTPSQSRGQDYYSPRHLAGQPKGHMRGAIETETYTFTTTTAGKNETPPYIGSLSHGGTPLSEIRVGNGSVDFDTTRRLGSGKSTIMGSQPRVATSPDNLLPFLHASRLCTSSSATLWIATVPPWGDQGYRTLLTPHSGHKRQRERSVPVAVDWSGIKIPLPSFLRQQSVQPETTYSASPDGKGPATGNTTPSNVGQAAEYHARFPYQSPKNQGPLGRTTEPWLPSDYRLPAASNLESKFRQLAMAGGSATISRDETLTEEAKNARKLRDALSCDAECAHQRYFIQVGDGPRSPFL